MAIQTLVFNGESQASHLTSTCENGMFMTNITTNVTSIASLEDCLYASDGSFSLFIVDFELVGTNCTASSGLSPTNPLILNLMTYPLVPGARASQTMTLTYSGTNCPTNPIQVSFTAIALDDDAITLYAYYNNEIGGNTLSFKVINPGNNFTYNVLDCSLA